MKKQIWAPSCKRIWKEQVLLFILIRILTQNLFYRSDNATLARLGVPAHTISTAKMDGEPHYHKVTDHIETLDMENMAMIIKSIALSFKKYCCRKGYTDKSESGRVEMISDLRDFGF